MARIEQLVYGTFNFTNGFTLVSASSGLQEPLTRRIVRICDRWGSVRSADFQSAIYHVPLADETAPGDPIENLRHLVCKVVQQGTDRGGRRAWHHQVLVLSHADYLECGADCFAFNELGLFKSRWFEIDQCGVMDVDPKVFPQLKRTSISPAHHPQIMSILQNLLAGRKVYVASKELTPLVSRLFREVLSFLPPKVRSGLSLATFTFDQDIAFDLFGLNDDSASPPAEITDLSPQTISGATKKSEYGSKVLPNPTGSSEIEQVLALFRAGDFARLDNLLD